jgi:hypothetical protein
MNLHDMPARPGPRSGFGEWMNEYFRDPQAFIVHPSAVRDDGTTTITAADLQRQMETLRAYQPVRRPIDWFSTAGTTPDDMWMVQRRRPDRATEILSDIYRFRDQLMRAGFRQRDIEEHMAYRVTPEDYFALQGYVAQEGEYRGPVYGQDRGTMTVMGLTVLPSR